LSDYAIFPKEVVYLYKQEEHTILNHILTSAPISNCLMQWRLVVKLAGRAAKFHL